jgi:hypothetical protein
MFLMPKIYNSRHNDLENNMAEAFQFVRKDLLKVYEKQWLEEEFRGESLQIYKAIQYHLAINLVVLMYLDFIEGFTPYEELKSKYRIKCLIEELACNGIQLKTLLEIFGMPMDKLTSGEGIDFVQIDKNHIVDGIDEPYHRFHNEDICELLKCQRSCTNLITDCVTKTYTVLNVDNEGLVTENCGNYLLIETKA